MGALIYGGCGCTYSEGVQYTRESKILPYEPWESPRMLSGLCGICDDVFGCELIKGETLYKIENATRYINCVFYLKSHHYYLVNCIFENCSFRNDTSLAALRNTQFINCSFSNLIIAPVRSNFQSEYFDAACQLDNISVFEVPITCFYEDANYFFAKIKKLKQLRELILPSSNIKSLPMEIMQLPRLFSLNLSFNKINCIPPAKNSKLVELKLNDNQISELSGIEQFENLSLLNLSKNLIGKLSVNFSQLKNLTILNLSHNQIITVPEKITELKNITHLNLSYNQITHIPITMKNLKNLKHLNISKNNISQKDLDYLKNTLPSNCILIRDEEE